MSQDCRILRDAERFSPAQCRAGRALINLSVADLALRSGLEVEAIEIYEAEDAELSLGELSMLGRAFNKAGVIAKSHSGCGDGVRIVRSMTAEARTPFASMGGRPGRYATDDALFEGNDGEV